MELFGRHGTDPAAAFHHGLREKHDLSDTVFLVDQFGYWTSLSRLGLNGRTGYTDGYLIEKWSQTLKMRIDRFHNSWVGSDQAYTNSLKNSCITTTARDRINRSTDKRQLKQSLT